MTSRIKSAEHLEEHELNKLLKHLSKNEEWLYYLIVRLGVSTALRFSDLSQIKWLDILNMMKSFTLTIKNWFNQFNIFIFKKTQISAQI